MNQELPIPPECNKLYSENSHDVQLYFALCREVALAVAAAVALSASESMVASSTGTDILSCLPLDKAAGDLSALRQAEMCIAKTRYDPFAAQVS